MKIVAVAGKFDPPHGGHFDHILKASHLGDFLVVITHPDYIVAAHSEKGFCALSLYERMVLLEGILLHFNIPGKVVVSNDIDGTVTESLRELKPDIFAKGGDRTDDSKIPQGELDACREIGCEIRYGIGDLLNSSSKIMTGGKHE